jgi:ATP-dependent Lhr-like helicase
VTISAADPLNLAGVILPGERIPSLSGKLLRFRDGVLQDDTLTNVVAISGDR